MPHAVCGILGVVVQNHKSTQLQVSVLDSVLDIWRHRHKKFAIFICKVYRCNERAGFPGAEQMTPSHAYTVFSPANSFV